MSSECKEKENGLKVRDGGEDFTEVDPRLLHVPFGDEACLVFDDGAGLVLLQFEDPM